MTAPLTAPGHDPRHQPPRALTAREQQFADLKARGFSQTQIAAQHGISVHSVAGTLRSARRKLSYHAPEEPE